MPELAHVPLPTSLTPPPSKRSLMASVRVYFYKLYNGADEGFRKFLISVGNKDAITGNRMFDRHMAVTQIIDAAKMDDNQDVINALPGDIYQCIVALMGKHGLNLKIRREQYKQLTAPAE